MKNFIKYYTKLIRCIVVSAFILFAVTIYSGECANAVPAAAVKQAAAKQTAAVSYTSVSPLDVVNCPSKYLNKNITFTAEFVAFTSLGLDYQPALREASKYIGILIKRPDVTDHTIPLSEMKIFVTRETAEKNIDIETGDKIKISGKVFSNALGDPWVDASSFTMLTQKSKTEKK